MADEMMIAAIDSSRLNASMYASLKWISHPIATPTRSAQDVSKKPVVADRKLANELIEDDGENGFLPISADLRKSITSVAAPCSRSPPKDVAMHRERQS